jgi:hypothetical protein
MTKRIQVSATKSKTKLKRKDRILRVRVLKARIKDTAMTKREMGTIMA